ncbi:MAG: YicC family protein [Brumimicrobium sp.]|nr:YicC family protein [Brumimicrobium sp.]MCO5269507.1 YicC family protein [Brumimicrobium sp.]
MLQSMTGYGKASNTFQNRKVSVEVRSLNSKGSDIYLKTPTAYRQYELSIRKKLQDVLLRGKIECTVSIETLEGSEIPSINRDLAIAYYKEMKAIAEQVGATSQDILTSIFRLQDVMQVKEEDASEEEWKVLENTLNEALNKLIQYRKNEGQTLEKDFTIAIQEIENRLNEVPKYETLRIDTIRDRMNKSFEKIKDAKDENRFEQELIYYIEKLDITEEKTRLQHHLNYFRDTMKSDEEVGRKLGFIAQEMGREINTLGSKSYHADLQKIVVEMKDYLEKVKEQVLNAL